ncbi:uncharacterized protein LOC131049995 isoform X2 [Cryptomeria japonica]|uniref:uncharacterized protein LOC131049995 isoform X2 n=1 Tax=Cryptomeria japonica TaxID=3369 RepID=UPI0027DA1F80|nr:uncharacterized protein LOC131049995 isoform X2 [Cryptomeria japonica]
MRASGKRAREESTRRKAGGNKYAEDTPDFQTLASLYSSFQPYVLYGRDGNGRPRIDWRDFNATRELTRVLLHHRFALQWWIPDGQLCPTVPNRLNYIHWIYHLLSSHFIPSQRPASSCADTDVVRGFDIGTGANCIYPLLGASLHGWRFVATDVTQVALEWARKNVESNPHLVDLIEVRKAGELEFGKNSCAQNNEEASSECLSTGGHKTESISEQYVLDCNSEVSILLKDGESNTEIKPVELLYLEVPSFEGSGSISKKYKGPSVLLGVIREGEDFDFCMCNPPFFESMEQTGANPRTACGGTMEEMVCPGGEQAFITRIIEDSIQLKERVRWYTTMVGRKVNLKYLTSSLRKAGVTMVQTTEFVQGRTSRWGLAWTFISPSKGSICVLPATEKTNQSFMLEGLQRSCTALQVLQSVEQFFQAFSASCKVDLSSFSVTVSFPDANCKEAINDISLKYGIKSMDEIAPKIIQGKNIIDSWPQGLTFRVSVFEQSPGTLLVKGLLMKKEISSSGTFSVLLLQLEETLNEKLGTKSHRTRTN